MQEDLNKFDYKPTFYNLEYRALFVEYMKRRMKMIEIMEAKEVLERIDENIKKYKM